VRAYQKRGLPVAPGMEIGHVVIDAAKWDVDAERDASKFDAAYMGSCWRRHGGRQRLCFPNKGSKVGQRIISVSLIPECHKSTSCRVVNLIFKQEHCTCMDSDLNFLKNPIYWLCHSVSKSTSKLILKPNFEG
jgi:hypothetical protein